jgi:hypothetical protein
MRREAEKGDARDPQDELLPPIGAAHLRIETEAVMNEISAAHWSKQHEQPCRCPCEEHGGIKNNNSKDAAHVESTPGKQISAGCAPASPCSDTGVRVRESNRPPGA